MFLACNILFHFSLQQATDLCAPGACRGCPTSPHGARAWGYIFQKDMASADFELSVSPLYRTSEMTKNIVVFTGAAGP